MMGFEVVPTSIKLEWKDPHHSTLDAVYNRVRLHILSIRGAFYRKLIRTENGKPRLVRLRCFLRLAEPPTVSHGNQRLLDGA